MKSDIVSQYSNRFVQPVRYIQGLSAVFDEFDSPKYDKTLETQRLVDDERLRVFGVAPSATLRISSKGVKL